MRLVCKIILILGLFLSGCSKDKDDTPLNIFSIQFRLEDEDGNDIFRQEIQNIDIIFFDGEGRYLSQKSLSKTDLDKYQGLIFNSRDRDLHLIFWANRLDNTIIGAFGDNPVIDDYRIYSKENNITKNGDPLYYASLKTSDLRKSAFEASGINFTQAHKVVSIYVKGFSDEVNGNNLLPQIELTRLPVGYDFYMSPLSDLINYKQASSNILTPEGYMAGVNFRTPHFPEDYTSKIRIIKSSTGESAYTVDLEELFSNQGEDIHKDNVVSIFIEFKAGEVIVTLPKWSGIGIEPEI